MYHREVRELVAAAPVLLEAHRPLDALATWRDLDAHSLGPIGEAVELLPAVGRSAGTVRADAGAHDVIVLSSRLWRLDDAEPDARGPRLLSILLDGLRAPRH